MSSTIREPLPTETEGRIEQTHSKRSIRDRLSSAVDHVSTGRFLALPLSDWVCSGFLGVVASAWLFRATYEFPPLVFLVLSAFFIVLAAAGRLILLALQMPPWIDRSFPTALIFGFLPVGFVSAILRVVAGVPFSILCLILIALVAGGLWQFRRSLESTFPRSDSNTIGMIATVLAAFAVTFRVTFFCFPAFLEDGPDLVVKMGDNEFYHASFVTFLDAPGPSWKLGSQNLAGRLSYFYHFVSYVEAAWLRSVTGVTSLTALFGFMTPLGVLFAALASYAFAASWYYPRLGFWVIALFFGLPDLAFLTQFTTLQQSIFAAPLIVLPATPANGYGLAHSMITILLVTCGLRSDRPGLVGIGLASALATVLWKAQLGINVSLALALLSLPYARRLLRPSAVVPPLVVLLGIVALSRLFFDSSRTPTAFIDKSLGEDLATWHLSMLPQTSLITRLEPWIHGATIDAFFARILLNALASFGILIILWLIVAASSLVRHRRLQLPMVVTGCSVAVFLSLGALLAENRTGFRFEMQFSPYLLPLLLLEITMLGACAQLLGIVRRKPVPLVWGFVCTIPLLLISTLLPQDRTLGMPFPKALADCTAYLRTHAGPFDVVQDSASDPSGLMSGMTERRTYVGILAFQRFVGMTDIVKSYNDRVAANEKLLHAGSIDELKSLAKETGIRWYVLWPDAEVGWPVDVLSSPVFRSGDFRVYDLNQLDAMKP